MLKKGVQAPDFELADEACNTVSLAGMVEVIVDCAA